jgi:hypothetical protein
MIPIEYHRDLIEIGHAVEIRGFGGDKLLKTIVETVQRKLKSTVTCFQGVHVGPLQ